MRHIRLFWEGSWPGQPAVADTECASRPWIEGPSAGEWLTAELDELDWRGLGLILLVPIVPASE